MTFPLVFRLYKEMFVLPFREYVTLAVSLVVRSKKMELELYVVSTGEVMFSTGAVVSTVK